jgi:DNA-binding SARP family transcriptional activator
MGVIVGAEVLERGVAQPLGGAKQHAVLAILILRRGELISGERLADELFGERPPPTAAKTLQGYISQLRKTRRGSVSDPRPRIRAHAPVRTARP